MDTGSGKQAGEGSHLLACDLKGHLLLVLGGLPVDGLLEEFGLVLLGEQGVVEGVVLGLAVVLSVLELVGVLLLVLGEQVHRGARDLLIRVILVAEQHALDQASHSLGRQHRQEVKQGRQGHALRQEGEVLLEFGSHYSDVHRVEPGPLQPEQQGVDHRVKRAVVCVQVRIAELCQPSCDLWPGQVLEDGQDEGHEPDEHHVVLALEGEAVHLLGERECQLQVGPVQAVLGSEHALAEFGDILPEAAELGAGHIQVHIEAAGG
jgi:hypothetical protein